MRAVLTEMPKQGKNCKDVDHLLPSNWSPVASS